MKLIKPKQISGEIMTLIDESDKFVVIASPYVQVKKWTKLRRTLSDLRNKNIPIEFYYRSDNEDSKKEIESLNVIPIPIEKLHCKIFMNEKEGIVSSMNLYQYSDTHSLDIAYKTETKKEYKELNKFYKRYLRDYNDPVLLGKDYVNDFMDELRRKLDSSFSFEYYDGEIEIRYERSTYTFFIIDNELRLEGILTQRQFGYALSNTNQVFENKSLRYELINGDDEDYDQVYSWIELKSKDLKKLYKSDYNRLLESIAEFIKTVNDIKVNEYKNRKDKW
jgi:hypothetical protein